GVFVLQLHVEANIAPVAQLLIYATSPSRQVIADSTKFNVEKCFSNKVDLSFSPSEGLPSSDTHLLFRASPRSLCAVRAVDKSVLLMKPEADLSPSSVYSLLPVKELHDYHHGYGILSEEPLENCIPLKKIILNGITYSPVVEMNEDDTYNILKQTSAAIKLLTITQITSFSPNHDAGLDLACLELLAVHIFSISSHSAVLDDRLYAMPNTPGEVTETVRKYFPETWIWSLVSVSSEGNAELDVTIPDTITEWKANTFCTSADTGFGLSPTVSLRAFQPFFVELTMPYSVVRGESFTLKATVFNYLSACIRVSVTLAQSAHFLASPVEKEEESYCLCENGRKTVAWLVTPKSLGQVEFSVSTEALQNQQPCGNAIVETPEKGRKDTVIRQLLVEPEGIEKETAQNSVLCVKG
ncbi:A2MG protein, partial [Atlantisia rogersi]|nr:A2MG protein [Atlantisia rogersi]